MELNPRDYRAWYGMGQTYEMLHMPFYALHYFRRATQLRPQDARMWCALHFDPLLCLGPCELYRTLVCECLHAVANSLPVYQKDGPHVSRGCIGILPNDGCAMTMVTAYGPLSL